MNWDSFDAAAFYEELGRKYPEASVVYSTLEGRLRRAFVQRFLQQQRGTLLDVGCNVGIHLERYPDPKIGVDIAPSVLESARRRIPEGTFYAGSAEAMDFLQAGSVDVVLCTEVLEHIERPQRAFGEFARVLRGDGRVLVTTPNRIDDHASDWIEADILSDYGVSPQSYFHTAYSPKQLSEMARDAGLTVVEQGSFGKEIPFCNRMAYPLFNLGSRINRKTLRSPRLEHRMRQGFFLLERAVHRATVLLGLSRRLTARVSEGKFAYVIARKPA